MRVGVLASGAGTNLQAILDHVHRRDGVEVVAVASDQATAQALERAGSAGVTSAVFASDDHATRADRDAAMAQWLVEREVQLVVLAGYMRLLSPGFLARFPQRVINVHPALLPAFPGLDAVAQALAYGVKVFGVTIHFVDDGVDSGAVIFQGAVPLPDATSPSEVMAALRPLEHELLCRAVSAFARGAIRIDPGNPRRVTVQAA